MLKWEMGTWSGGGGTLVKGGTLKSGGTLMRGGTMMRGGNSMWDWQVAKVDETLNFFDLKYHCYLHNSDCDLTFHSIDSRLDSISNDTENSAC